MSYANVQYRMMKNKFKDFIYTPETKGNNDFFQIITHLFCKVSLKNYLTVNINHTNANPKRCLPCLGKAKVISSFSVKSDPAL